MRRARWQAGCGQGRSHSEVGQDFPFLPPSCAFLPVPTRQTGARPRQVDDLGLFDEGFVAISAERRPQARFASELESRRHSGWRYASAAYRCFRAMRRVIMPSSSEDRGATA